MRVMKFFWLMAWLGIATAAWANPAVNSLREIVVEQKAALTAAKASEDASVLEDYRPRLQKVVDRYEALLTKHPDFAAGWASYGLFLCDPLLEERKTALPLLLKANGLDPDIPVVKNQIGVLMAEDGRVVDALNYFLAASDLAPTEPLYHFQIGLLLDEAREEFLKTKAWKREKLDADMLAAFGRATALAPDRVDFAYRAAEAFYGVEPPQWDAAYLAWSRLEGRLEGRNETQAVRLHRARVRWKQGYAGEARELLESVDAPALLAQKARLAEEFAAEDKAEAEEAAAKVKRASSEGR
jgi:tetratricopeptide (TPR) repeat protein